MTDALAQAAADGVPTCRVELIRAIGRNPRLGAKQPGPGSNRFWWLVDYPALLVVLKARPRAGQVPSPPRPSGRRAAVSAAP